MDLHFSMEFWPLMRIDHSDSRGRQARQEATAAPRMTRMVAWTVVAPFVCVLQVGPLAFPDRFGAGYERKKVVEGQLQGLWPEQVQGWTCHQLRKRKPWIDRFSFGCIKFEMSIKTQTKVSNNNGVHESVVQKRVLSRTHKLGSQQNIDGI